MSRIRFTLINSGAIAPTNEVALYAKTDRQLYLMDQDGREIQLGSGAGGRIFETKIRYLTIEDITNQYLDLTEKATPKFIQVIRDRVVYMAPEDFEISEVNGVTRLTFSGATVSGGDEEFVVNEKIIICYAK